MSSESSELEELKARMRALEAAQSRAYFPRSAKRVLIALAACVPLTVFALPQRISFTANERIKAQDFNANFQALWEGVESVDATVSTHEGRIAALEAREPVRSAQIKADGDVVSQTGSWITEVVHDPVSHGHVFHFAAGAFSSTPTCVATAHLGNQVPPTVECYDPDVNGITCIASVDTAWFLVCVGS